MGILIHTAPAVKCCPGCGTELLYPGLETDLCLRCQDEVRDDMKTQSAEVEELRRQRDVLLSACESVVEAIRGPLPVSLPGVASLLQGAIDHTKPAGVTAWTRGEPGACPDCLALPCVCNADCIPD